MYLSDADILERISSDDPDQQLVIEPMGPGALQPASVDVRLGETLLTFDCPEDGVITPDQRQTIKMRQNKFDAAEPEFILKPGQMALGATYETIGLPPDLLARIEGKSSLARLGLAVHVTAGIADPGWRGALTFEIVNLAPYPIRLRYQMYCAQLIFSQLTSPALRPYGHPGLGSRYQDDTGPSASRYYLGKSLRPEAQDRPAIN